MRKALGVVLALSMAGCLKTRSDVKDTEQRQVLSQQVNSLQKENADVSSRFADVNEELRDLRGRVEVVENRVNSGSSESAREAKALSEQTQESGRKMALLQEAASHNDAQIQALSAEIAALKAELAAVRAGQAAEASKPTSAPEKDTYVAGLEYLKAKDWKKAILSLQEYREKNPKGNKLPQATYRIGTAFQELGMNDEARTFYNEVLEKYPGGPDATRAKARLAEIAKSGKKKKK